MQSIHASGSVLYFRKKKEATLLGKYLIKKVSKNNPNVNVSLSNKSTGFSVADCSQLM